MRSFAFIPGLEKNVIGLSHWSLCGYEHLTTWLEQRDMWGGKLCCALLECSFLPRLKSTGMWVPGVWDQLVVKMSSSSAATFSLSSARWSVFRRQVWQGNRGKIGMPPKLWLCEWVGWPGWTEALMQAVKWRMEAENTPPLTGSKAPS